jgi:hypothetical protein
VNTERGRLNITFQGRLVDLAVALEGHLTDDRILDHGDEDASRLAVNAHIGEQAGGEQRFEGFIDFAGVVGIADVELEVGADRLGLYAAVADHLNLTDRGTLRLHRRRRNEHRLADGEHERMPTIATRIECQPPTCTFHIRHSSRLPFSAPFPLLPYPSASGGRFTSTLHAAETTSPFLSPLAGVRSSPAIL